MTLNEAIQHAEAIANSQCGECAEEHRQLAEWLKELKHRREAVEQKHGHWIEEKTETGRKVYCSNCKHSAPFICIADDYYGARMHGEI